LSGHLEAQRSAFGDFGVLKPVAIQRLVVQPHFLNVRMIRRRIVGKDRQLLVL
jgi:hypothetical protein